MGMFFFFFLSRLHMLWRMTFIFMSCHERRVYRYFFFFPSMPHGDEFGFMSADFTNAAFSGVLLN